jgi:hypothetical protein
MSANTASKRPISCLRPRSNAVAIRPAETRAMPPAKLEKAAKLERIDGRGWHSLGRKFATDLKHIPLADLCNMGGWKDHNTVLKCYMRPDEATMRNALERSSEHRVG